MPLLEILIQLAILFFAIVSVASLWVLGWYILSKEENVVLGVIVGCFRWLKRRSDNLGDRIVSLLTRESKRK